MTIGNVEKIKIETRENQCPYFDDEEIAYYLDKNNGNVNNTIYELLIINRC